MSASVLNIIKIGGSVITRKDKKDCFDPKAAAAVAAQIPRGSILVHGSGSFGKPTAIELGYLCGVIHRKEQRKILHVRQKLATLNNLFMEMLIEHHGPAVATSATAIFSDTARISFSGRRLIDKLLARGITPVIYSDLIMYGEDKLRVLSSDEIVSILAPIYRPKHIVFATDVDGVYRSDNLADIYSVLTPHDLRTRIFIARSHNDVTGGMHGKLECAVKAARFSLRCIILNGLHPDRIRRACEGARDVPGTLVYAKQRQRHVVPRSADVVGRQP